MSEASIEQKENLQLVMKLEAELTAAIKQFITNIGGCETAIVYGDLAKDDRLRVKITPFRNQPAKSL